MRRSRRGFNKIASQQPQKNAIVAMATLNANAKALNEPILRLRQSLINAIGWQEGQLLTADCGASLDAPRRLKFAKTENH